MFQQMDDLKIKLVKKNELFGLANAQLIDILININTEIEQPIEKKKE